MPVTPSPVSRSAIVTRLRSAGCVFAEDEAELLISAAATPAELTAMVDRRVSGLPLEQVVGWADFCGLRIAVDPGVFVPRRRTEFLVRQAIGLAPPRPVIVDLCCGSGAVGAALAAALDPAELHAADIDPAAVALRPPQPRPGRRPRLLRRPLRAAARRAARPRRTSWSPTCRTCPPGRSGCCRPRPGCTSHGWRWTAAATAWTSCAGWPRRLRCGWPPAAACWLRSANGRNLKACDTARRGGLVPRVARSAELAVTVLIASMDTG